MPTPKYEHPKGKWWKHYDDSQMDCELDPAADPEVQARVLRAARAWKVQTGRYAVNLTIMAAEIENGRTVLPVEEERT